MTFEDRVRAVSQFGFSERQTRFLVTVALHSGFCLRRQYADFAGLQYGRSVREFLNRLVSRRLASRLTFRRDRRDVYHLRATALYAAIGQDDNRNRRTTSPALICRKLMVLDYVLGSPLTDWYATEHDKVALFTKGFGVSVDDLPQRVYRAATPGTGSTTRYFIHKLPIAVAAEPRVISFVFLVTDTSGHSFSQFLDDHARLLGRLPDWRIVAVCPRHLHGLPACEAAFREWGHRGSNWRTTSDIGPLRRYFVARDFQERGEVARLSLAEIDNLRAARRRYAAPSFERLYRAWRQHGDAAFGDVAAHAVAAAITGGRGQLLPHQLPLRYDRFGTRAGVA